MKMILIPVMALIAINTLATCQGQSEMSVDSKTVVLRSEAELWNRGNLAVADQLYSPAYICHFVAGIEWKGIEDLKRQVMATRAAFPD